MKKPLREHDKIKRKYEVPHEIENMKGNQTETKKEKCYCFKDTVQ